MGMRVVLAGTAATAANEDKDEKLASRTGEGGRLTHGLKLFSLGK